MKKNGRLQIELLWQYDKIELSNGCNQMTKRRLDCCNKLLSKDQALEYNMKNQMQEYLSKGCARILSEDELYVNCTNMVPAYIFGSQPK